jgi:uncharacterized protein (DUF58 family)
VNFARLNHILIPTTRTDRDRFRKTRTGRALRPVFGWYLSLTDEGRILSVLWLLCGAAGLDVASTQIYLLWSALTGLFFGSFVLRRRYKLKGSVTIEAPHRVTAGDIAVLPICVTNRGPQAAGIRIERPLLPWDGRYIGRAPVIPSLGEGQTERALVRVRFSARGEHDLDAFHAARVVPFNIAQGPPLATGGARFLVVPRPARIQSLTLPTATRYQPGGVHMAARLGESMEFVGLRAYRPGDRVRDLHVRSWARTGVPVVREYEQEYFTRVGVVLDTDLSVADEVVFEAAVSLAAGAVMHLSGGEALVDLLVVGESVHQLTLGRHLGSPEQALDLLACVEAGPELDVARLAETLTPHLPRLSCVVLVVLSWDAQRAALLEQLARGTACRVLVVGEGGGPGVTTVSPANINAGIALSL